MRKLFASLFAALVIVTASAPAEARRVWPGVGAGGGVLSTVQCPEDKAMVGLTGASGDFIDRLQIVCATLYADGTYGPPEPYGDPVGSAGGGQKPMTVCPRNAKLFDMAIVVDSSNLRYLSAVNFHCRDQSGNILLQSWYGLGENFFRGNGEQQNGLQSCPQEHFVGLKIYFRDYVKAVGVICDNVDVTPVAVAPRPPPLRSTGKMPRPAPGPSVASVLAFQGAWQTVTSQNGHFTVILQVTNPTPSSDPGFTDLYVTGQFINSDGAAEYNGTLQGTIPRFTRTLHYSFVQPNSSGTGQFTLSPDGNSISGSGKAGDAEFTWNGTRAK